MMTMILLHDVDPGLSHHTGHDDDDDDDDNNVNDDDDSIAWTINALKSFHRTI